MKFTLLIVLFILSPPASYSFLNWQDSLKNGKTLGDTLDISDDDDTEKLIESQTGDFEDSGLLDNLKNLESNPLDLNSALLSELESIPFLNDVIAKKIIEYRTMYKKFNSISELKKIKEIDEDLYKKITKFLIVKGSKVDFRKDEFGRVERVIFSESISRFNFSRFDFKMINRFTNDLQPGKGYLNEIYQGTRAKIYNRLDLRYSYKNLLFSGGVVSEKDAGERKMFDFISGYIEMKNKGILNHVLVGDYTLEFGQGITMWNSLSFSKGNDAVSAVKKNTGNINSYSSVNEVQFFRGIAAKLNLETPIGNLGLFGFFSDNFFDASSDLTSGELSAFYFDGYHRTESEIKRENAAKEKLFGGRLSYELGSARMGLTYYKSYFSESFMHKSPDEGYDFSGSRTNALGVDYDFAFKNMNFFGEWSGSYTGAIGGVSGARIIFPSKKFGADVVFQLRNYPMDFIMLHSNGFGERSGTTQNELGIYSGIKLKIPDLFTLDVYYDQYKFPYRTFSNPVPTAGKDFLAFSEFNLTKGLKVFTKYKNESKEDAAVVLDEFGREVKRILPRNQSNYRFQFVYDVSNSFRVRSRVEYVFVDYSSRALGIKISEKGILLFSDFRIIPFTELILDGRFIIFQTDSYDSRIYEYENELDGVVSNQGLFGKGRRWYLLFKYKPFSYLQLSAKYSETFLDGVKSIGSGNDEVLGDFKNRFSVQLEIKF